MESARSLLVGSNVLIHHIHTVQNMHTVLYSSGPSHNHNTIHYAKTLLQITRTCGYSQSHLQYLEAVNTIRYGYIAVLDPRYPLCLVRHEQYRWPGPCSRDNMSLTQLQHHIRMLQPLLYNTTCDNNQLSVDSMYMSRQHHLECIHTHTVCLLHTLQASIIICVLHQLEPNTWTTIHFSFKQPPPLRLLTALDNWEGQLSG